MKISPNTITILKNFSQINSSIQFRKGSKLKTISPQKVIVAEANIEESLPKNFEIYDLNKFLSVESIMKDPDFAFGDEEVEIKSGNRSVTIPKGDPEVIKLPPEGDFPMPDAIVRLKITSDEFESVREAARVLSLPEICVEGNGKKAVLVARDGKNPKLGNYTIDIATDTNQKFVLIFQVENLKILPGGYEIAVAPRVGHFRHLEYPVQYWVALDQNSEFPTAKSK